MRRVSIRLTNGGIKVALSRQESGRKRRRSLTLAQRRRDPGERVRLAVRDPQRVHLLRRQRLDVGRAGHHRNTIGTKAKQQCATNVISVRSSRVTLRLLAPRRRAPALRGLLL